MISADDVLDVLDRLDAADVAWWIEGGWGIDALLGSETRPHDDLDVAIHVADVARLALIFPEFERIDKEWWPARYVLRDPTGRQVDFHPIEFDEHGDAWQTMIDGSRTRRPAAGMSGSGRVGGREVRCVTAELQLVFHDYADPDDVDWDDVRVLCERFGLAPPSAYGTRPAYVDPKRRSARPRM